MLPVPFMKLVGSLLQGLSSTPKMCHGSIDPLGNTILLDCIIEIKRGGREGREK